MNNAEKKLNALTIHCFGVSKCLVSFQSKAETNAHPRRNPASRVPRDK